MMSSGVLMSPRTRAVARRRMRREEVILPTITPSTTTLVAMMFVFTLPLGPICSWSTTRAWPSNRPSMRRLPRIANRPSKNDSSPIVVFASISICTLALLAVDLGDVQVGDRLGRELPKVAEGAAHGAALQEARPFDR